MAGAAAAAISRHRVKKVRNERGDGVSPDGPGMYNTNLFPGQALGPDLDRLRLIGAPAAVVYSVIISAPTLKFFIIEAALPLGRRKLFDTLQDPLRFSVVPVTLVSNPRPCGKIKVRGRLRGPIRAIIRRHAARVAAVWRISTEREEVWIRRRDHTLFVAQIVGPGPDSPEV